MAVGGGLKHGMYTVKPIVVVEGGPPPPCGMYAVRGWNSARGGDGEGREKRAAAGAEARADESGALLAQISRVAQRDARQLGERQERLLVKLETLRSRIEQLRKSLSSPTRPVEAQMTINLPKNDLSKDVVVNVDPAFIPYSLMTLKRLLNLRVNCHVHSSIGRLPEAAAKFSNELADQNPPMPSVTVTLIWKDVGAATELITSSTPVTLRGEINVLRYLIAAVPNQLSYSNDDSSWKIDSQLDLVYESQSQRNQKQLEKLTKTMNDDGKQTIAHVALRSALMQSKNVSGFSAEVKKWLSKYE